MSDKENGVWACIGMAWMLLMANSPARADRPVFRCDAQGTVTYSDTACAGAIDKIEVASSSLNAYSVDEPIKRTAAAALSRKIAHRQTHDSIAEEQLRHKEKCKDSGAQLAAIAAKEWAGASGRKRTMRLDRLHEQQRKLEQHRREEKCR